MKNTKKRRTHPPVLALFLVLTLFLLAFKSFVALAQEEEASGSICAAEGDWKTNVCSNETEIYGNVTYREGVLLYDAASGENVDLLKTMLELKGELSKVQAENAELRNRLANVEVAHFPSPPPPSPPPSPLPSPPPSPPPPPPPSPPFFLVIDGVQAHWDAFDLSTLGDGATLSSNGWLDKSGNGRGALAPYGTVTYQATGLSSAYPCLYLSGSSTSLYTGGGTNYLRQTIVMVFRWDECNCLGTCGQRVHYLWDWRNEWGGTYIYGNYDTSGENAGPWQQGSRWINGELNNNFNTNQCSFFQGTTYHATEPIVMIWEAQNANTGDDMYLFSRYTYGENVRVQLAEVQIYASTLTSDEKSRLECGLADKWGISSVTASTKCSSLPPFK